jgi:tetratricopeptide (TPR) repeat protein
MARYADNDPAKAERAVRQLLAINPDYAGAHCQLGGILLAQNRPTEALEIMAKESDEQSRLLCMPMALWALDRHAEAEAMLAEVWDRYHDSAAYGIAGCYAYMGKKDEAFKWLNVALASHGSMVQFINADPDMRPLYSDPRFNELLAKAKAPE